MSLQTILKDIELNREFAEMNAELGPETTRVGRMGQKRNAVENIKRLKAQYRKELMTSTLFIIVTGSARNHFADMATGETFGCLANDPDSIYTELASKIDTRLYGRESTKNLFNIITNLLQDKALDLDIQSYNGLMFNERYNTTVTTAEELVPVLRRAVNEQVGSEIVGINAIFSIVDEAIKKQHSAIVTPVILCTEDESFARDLLRNLKSHRGADGVNRGLTQNVFLVGAGKVSKELKDSGASIFVKQITEDSVGEVLADIRAKVLQ